MRKVSSKDYKIIQSQVSHLRNSNHSNIVKINDNNPSKQAHRQKKERVT